MEKKTPALELKAEMSEQEKDLARDKLTGTVFDRFIKFLPEKLAAINQEKKQRKKEKQEDSSAQKAKDLKQEKEGKQAKREKEVKRAKQDRERKAEQLARSKRLRKKSKKNKIYYDEASLNASYDAGDYDARLLALPGGLSLRLLRVKAGEFEMGSAEREVGRDHDELQYRVKLRDYWLGQTEVTQAQWVAVMANNPSERLRSDNPVENVDWNDAMDFCRKLTVREEQAGRLPMGYKYSLPTEAQWEFACRAGGEGAFNSGNDQDASQANFNGNFPCGKNLSGANWARALPVGRCQPNTWGFFDMHGNVFEWCRDWYGSYSDAPVRNPQGPKQGSLRVYRGGSWIGLAWHCRSANRFRWSAENSLNDLGFRLALVPK